MRNRTTKNQRDWRIGALALAVLAFAGALATSCVRYEVDPGAGEETIYLPTLDHADQFEVAYLRTAEEGPVVFDKNAWTVGWRFPLNHPDIGLWMRENLPENAEAANLKTRITTPWYGPLVLFPSLGFFRVDHMHFQFDPVRLTPVKQEVFPAVPAKLPGEATPTPTPIATPIETPIP